MVKRLYPTDADFENLSQLRTEISNEANQFDYSNVVVNKPWGYEYLWFQNTAVAVWMLHLASGRATSLHCHARKRTSLIVIKGRVECSTFEGRHLLGAGEAIVLEPCVFHSTRSQSPDGALVMEVETPPLKGDLLRYRDDFGREGKGYEPAQQYSTDYARFDYQPLRQIEHGGRPFGFKGITLHYCQVKCLGDLQRNLAPCGLAVPFLGQMTFGRQVVADIGEAIPLGGIPLEKCPAAFPPVELLQIWVDDKTPAV